MLGLHRLRRPRQRPGQSQPAQALHQAGGGVCGGGGGGGGEEEEEEERGGEERRGAEQTDVEIHTALNWNSVLPPTHSI